MDNIRKIWIEEKENENVLYEYLKLKDEEEVNTLKHKITVLKSKNTFLSIICYFLFIICILETLGLLGILK